MKVADYPEVSTLLTDIQNWDRITNPTSYGAGAYASLYYQLTPFYYQLGKDRVFSLRRLYMKL